MNKINENTNETTLASRLKSARKETGLSQSQAARKVGITQASLSDLETGVSKKTLYIGEFAKIYNVNPVWLSSGEEPRHLSIGPEGYEELNDINKAAVDNLVRTLAAGQKEGK